MDIDSMRAVFSECSIPFGELLNLSAPGDLIYISEPSTKRLRYFARPGQKTSLLPAPEPVENLCPGVKCYEACYHSLTQCAFCPVCSLSKSQYTVWSHHDARHDRHYMHMSKLCSIHGAELRFDAVYDVTSPERMQEILERTAESRSLLAGFLDGTTAASSPGTKLSHLIQSLCCYFGSEGGYIHSTPPVGWTGCVVEWPRSSSQVSHFMDIDAIFKTAQDDGLLTSGTILDLKDTPALGKYGPSLVQELEQHSIQNLLAIPLLDAGTLRGTLVLMSVSQNQGQISLLSNLVPFILSLLGQQLLLEQKNGAVAFDSVTGLLSGSGFHQSAVTLLQNNRGKKFSIWYCDIKNFKYINDFFGYSIGDRLLMYWADYLKSELLPGETCCRLSADNMALLLSSTMETDFSRRFDAMVSWLNLFPPFAERRYRVELVCGIILVDSSTSEDIDTLLNKANIAKKSICNNPGSGYAVYRPALGQKIAKNLLLESEMPPALLNQEFIPFLQPKVRIQSDRDHCIYAEALVRWVRNGKVYAMPDDFISLFEESGSIVDLDFYILHRACDLVNEIKRQLSPCGICISVNVSRVTLLQDGFVEVCRSIREAHGVQPGEIELEITETAAVGAPDTIRALLPRLKAAGFPCAMDDFGTGQSSLNLLQTLPLDALKLDRMFFLHKGDDGRRNVIVDSIIQMARRLEMTTVAEGVEDANQVDQLKALGCDYIQGFIFSEPMSVDDFIDWVRASSEPTACATCVASSAPQKH